MYTAHDAQWFMPNMKSAHMAYVIHEVQRKWRMPNMKCNAHGDANHEMQRKWRTAYTFTACVLWQLTWCTVLMVHIACIADCAGYTLLMLHIACQNISVCETWILFCASSADGQIPGMLWNPVGKFVLCLV
jgi:hypothetical protein